MEVILDNSICELGQSVTIDLIVDAHSLVRPDVTVLPDVYEDAAQTITDCLVALEEWPKKLGPYMIVPQGHTLEEFFNCAAKFAQQPEIHYWGVPRNLVRFLGTRGRAIDIVHMLNPKRKIHLLGFSDNMLDDLYCARNPKVYGIDSAVPIRVEGNFDPTKDPGKRGDWWDTTHPTQQQRSNYQTVQEWIR